MVLPPALVNNSLAYALNLVQNNAAQAKEKASGAVSLMAAGSVNTAYVFTILDSLNGLISNLNSVKNTAGLDTYATTQMPNYAGTLTTDINATIAAAQACVDWVVTNFPKDTTGTWLLGYSLNSDGSRTMRNFTSVQTTGLRTALNNLLATIG